MALKFKCEKCSQDLIVKYLKAGETAKCPHCEAENIIPDSAIETKEEPQYAKAKISPTGEQPLGKEVRAKVNTKLWNRVIAVIEILGGAGGVIFLLSPSSLPILIHLVFLGLCLLSVIAGLFLWMNRQIGNTLSIVIQALQVPQFSLAGVSYMFVAGTSLFLFKLEFGLARWGFDLSRQSEPSSLGINIVAVLFLCYLIKYRRIEH